MTAVTGAMPGAPDRLVGSLAEERELTRLEELLVDRSGSGMWWSAMARRVEATIDAIWADRAAPEGTMALHEEIKAEQPRLAPVLARLEADRLALVDEFTALRMLVSQSVGESGGVARVIAATTEVIALFRSYQRRARAVVYDAYCVDLGVGG
ncbi:MAG: hypothetical protein GC157_02195 [Frankiales bacterium]|nr:hypothetical protein [Frankiales bacterium]